MLGAGVSVGRGSADKGKKGVQTWCGIRLMPLAGEIDRKTAWTGAGLQWSGVFLAKLPHGTQSVLFVSPIRPIPMGQVYLSPVFLRAAA